MTTALKKWVILLMLIQVCFSSNCAVFSTYLYSGSSKQGDRCGLDLGVGSCNNLDNVGFSPRSLSSASLSVDCTASVALFTESNCFGDMQSWAISDQAIDVFDALISGRVKSFAFFDSSDNLGGHRQGAVFPGITKYFNDNGVQSVDCEKQSVLGAIGDFADDLRDLIELIVDII